MFTESALKNVISLKQRCSELTISGTSTRDGLANYLKVHTKPIGHFIVQLIYDYWPRPKTTAVSRICDAYYFLNQLSPDISNRYAVLMLTILLVRIDKFLVGVMKSFVILLFYNSSFESSVTRYTFCTPMEMHH